MPSDLTTSIMKSAPGRSVVSISIFDGVPVSASSAFAFGGNAVPCWGSAFWAGATGAVATSAAAPAAAPFKNPRRPTAGLRDFAMVLPRAVIGLTIPQSRGFGQARMRCVCVIFIPRPANMEPITRDIVHFLWALEPKQLSAEVIDRAKYLLLDYLGVVIRGSQSESSQSVYRMLGRAGGHGGCTVFGQKLRAAPEYAALANGAAAHSIELDDTHQAGSIHLGVVMYSVAIALSESAPGIDMKRFISAVVAGYEMAARLGIAVQPKDHYELGFHPTATCGVFGAAVTASKLLGLSEEQMLSAVGIAGSMAAGSLEFLANGAWTKRLHPGLAA